MKFAYTAKNSKGEVQSGFIEAYSEETAIDLLQKANLVILKIEKKHEASWHSKFALGFRRVSLKEIAVFTRQLATLFEAQISITETLQTVYNQTAQPVLREAIFDIYSDIEAGLSLSDALSKHGHVFSSFYINMVRAAELTGRLDSALSYLADYYDSQAIIQAKMRNAMIYPIFLVGLFVIVIGIMAVVVIPQLGTVISESGLAFDQLPLMTRILFATGDFLRRYYLLTIGFLFGTLALLLRYFSSEEGQLFLGTMMLHTPILGDFLRKVFVSRFAETLGVLLKGNIPVAQSLEISADVIGNVYYQEVINEIAKGVRQGANISDLLLQYPEYFPPLVAQMILVGEKTGRLEELLTKTSRFYAREVESIVNALTEIIQPVLIVLLGVLIGGLIAAVILPIYQIAQQF